MEQKVNLELRKDNYNKPEFTITSEDYPTNQDIDNGVEMQASADGEKSLYNNYRNKITVYPTHDGFIRIQMTDEMR